ncbi:MAG: LysR family transcriptional regulator [[Clostridium] scindens]
MNKYEIILSVCETHSISKTAEKLCYTQSAISQAIKGFEKRSGPAAVQTLQAWNGTDAQHGRNYRSA